MADGPYDDLTPEDEEKLKTLEGDNVAPPTENEAGAAPPTADPGASPPPPPAPEPTEEDEYQAWLKANEGKSPEELQRLAFQQSKRANREAFQARRQGETMQQFQTRLAGALERAEARRAALADRSRSFQEKLEKDPDGATKEVFQSLAEREAAEIDREEDEARMDAAIALASRAIPEFPKVFPTMQAFGGEMGYSAEELAGIRDGRDLCTLYLAERFANLVKSGVVDMRGNLLNPPPAVETTDPRLTPAAEAVTTLSSAPARPPGSAKSALQQAEAYLKLSDEEFDKLDPKVLEDLQRTLG